MLSLKPRPFVQSFFDMHASRQSHALLPFFSFFGDVTFSEYFCTIIAVFSLYGDNNASYVLAFRVVFFIFLPCDHGLDF